MSGDGDKGISEIEWVTTMEEMKIEMDTCTTYTLAQFCVWQNVVEHQEQFTNFLLREGMYREIYDKRDWDVLADCCDRYLLYHVC